MHEQNDYIAIRMYINKLVFDFDFGESPFQSEAVLFGFEITLK